MSGSSNPLTPDRERPTDGEDATFATSPGFSTPSMPEVPATRVGPATFPQSVVPPGLPMIPGYDIEGVLGRGGMGVVYRAVHQALKRPVALKMILAAGHADAAALARFRIEAEAAARLQHPNIVQVFEVGEADGHPYCALELVEGGSLAARLREQSLTPCEAAKLVEALARAVHLAHSRNVVHRDLKPGNVLLASGACERPGGAEPGSSMTPLAVPKITDFGLARQLDADSAQTRAGEVMGTPSYMAPEQAAGRGHAAGPAADIWSLGAILYECLTGRPPFKGDTVLETLEQVRESEPVSPSQLAPRESRGANWRDLETICLKCLRKQPEKRYASASELAEDLGRFLRGEPVQARPVGAIERAAKWARRNPALAALIVVSFGALISLIAGQAHYASQLEERNRDVLRESEAARASAERAREQEALAHRRFYAAQMNLADAALRDGRGKLLADRLDTLQPAAGQDDPRGFEWHLLNRRRDDFLRGFEMWQIQSASLTPDGCGLLLAGLSSERTPAVEVRDVGTGQLLVRLSPTADVLRAALSPDGKQIATAEADHVVRLWDALTGRKLREFREPKLRFGELHVALAFHPFGVGLAAGGARVGPDGRSVPGGLVRVWPLADNVPWLDHTFERSKAYHSHPHITSLAFHPRGDRLAAGGIDGLLFVWRLRSPPGAAPEWEKPVVLPEENYSTAFGSVMGVAYSSEGSTLAASFGTMVRVWDAETLTQRQGLPPGPSPYWSIAFHPHDREKVLTGGLDGVARVWNLYTGRPTATFLGHSDRVLGVSFSADGRLVVTADASAARLWDQLGGRSCRPVVHTSAMRAVAWSPDGRHLASAGGSGLEVLRSDARSGLPERWLGRHEGSVTALAYGREGWLASGGKDAVVRVWQPDGQPGPVLRGHSGDVLALAFGPDGRLLVSGSADGTARVWDARAGRLLHVLKGHEKWVLGTAITGNSGSILTVGRDNAVRVWDPDSGQEVRQLKLPDSFAGGLAVSPNSRWLAVCVHQGLAVWDLADRDASPRLLRGHPKEVLSTTFCPDSRRLVSGAVDGTIKVWDVLSGQELVTLDGHTWGVTGLAFSPDGLQLASAEKDGYLMQWDARPWTKELRVEREAVGLLAQLRRASGALLREELAEAAARANGVPAPVRELARDLAGRAQETPADLASHCWSFLANPAGASERARCLRLAERACQHDPDRALFQVMRGVFLVLNGKHAEAATILDRTPVSPDDPTAFQFGEPLRLAYLARARHALGQHEAARTALARLRGLAQDPRHAGDFRDNSVGARALRDAVQQIESSIADLLKRAESDAVAGRWREAVAGFDLLLARQDAEPRHHYLAAVAYLAAGDRAGYRRTCAAALKRFGDTKDLGIANVIAWTCVLAPGGVDEYSDLLKVSERAVAAQPNQHNRLGTLGLTLHRSGKHAEALARFRASSQKRGNIGDVWEHLLPALPLHGLGKTEEARASLQKAERWLADNDAKVRRWYWVELQEIALLRREIAALIESK